MPYKDPEVQRAYQREWKAKRRQEWINKHGPCVDCGSWEDPEVDHVDPSTKVDHKVWSWSQKRRDAELAKCVVRCEGCHKTKTAKEALADHGTRSRYENHGCRCEECCAVKAIHNARRRYDPSTKSMVWAESHPAEAIWEAALS